MYRAGNKNARQLQYTVPRAVSSAKSRPSGSRPHGHSARPSFHLSDLYLRQLNEDLLRRRLPWLQDYMTPVPATLLKKTLVNFLPYHYYRTDLVSKLPAGHHLVYFPSHTRTSTLYPDGTDQSHSPGPPFTRRMWAGGSINFFKPIELDLSAFHIVEKIIDVRFRGEGDEQKVFIKIKRSLRRGKARDDVTDDKDTYVDEFRNIVFMHGKPQNTSGKSEQPSVKYFIPTGSADFFVKLTPTPALLFRFSALTFNAHAIHLDKQYCREVEGHRNLLVHGPLTLVLMLDVLKIFMAKEHSKEKTNYRHESISSIIYRNLAPLYAEEEMKVCVKRKKRGKTAGSFEVWIEGKGGGFAVKGSVETCITPGQGPELERPPKIVAEDNVDAKKP